MWASLPLLVTGLFIFMRAMVPQSQPQPAQARTRSSQGVARMPSREELVKLNQDLMSSAAQAREYLEKLGYALVDVQGEKTTLSHMLLLLAHSTSTNVLQKGIRVVATLLE